MYLERLRIVEGSGEQREIRNIEFKKGLNIIVDETDENNSGKGNNVGKTTFLKLIDICLGAQDKKYIWTDNDTGSETTILKNYINVNKVFVELAVNGYLLKVELFDRGRRYINNEPFTHSKYVDFLNDIFFENSGPPTFRQLIGKFVRIKQKIDSDSILKYLHPNTTNAEYQNIYEFLFKLSSQQESRKKLELRNEIDQLKKDIIKIIRLHNFSNIDDLKERIRIVSATVNELQEQLDVLIRNEDYQENLKRISNIKHEISKLNDSIEAALFKKSKIREILLRETEDDDYIDESILREFYEDVKFFLGSLPKEFDDLVSFNKTIKRNKIIYYQNRLREIEEQLNVLEQKRDRIVRENLKLLRIIDEDNYKSFESIHKELIYQSEQLGELTKVLEIYNKLTSDLKIKNEEYNSIIEISDSLDNLSKFNEYFTKYSYEVFGQRLYLTRENSFPLKLSNVDEGLGTGYRKSITLLLDIAYVSFINEMGLYYPKFFVHDVLETVDEHNLSKIVSFIRENGSQFVFAILKEKIQNYQFINESDIVLKLSKNNKLFKV